MNFSPSRVYHVFTCSLVLFLWAPYIVVSQNENPPWTYTIVAPEKIRPDSDYFFSISTYNNKNPVNFRATISGFDNSTRKFNEIYTALDLRQDETRLQRFGIGSWGIGNYKLIVEIEGDGFKFRNDSKLTYESKSFSVFIQTDKAIYKPGQKVFFRAIVVRPTLVTADLGANYVYVEDDRGNRVKQWDRVFTSYGVLAFDFQLSENPNLGEWCINVEIDRKKFTKYFTVAEYMLPTFNVEVNLPSYVTYNRSDLTVNVRATYTYDKPVKGQVTLTVQRLLRPHSLYSEPLHQYQTKAMLDGSVDIPVHLVRDLQLNEHVWDAEIEFFALVEEDLTGRKYNKTAILPIYPRDIYIEPAQPGFFYKPNLTNHYVFKVAYRDDTPVEDNGPPVKLIYGYGRSESELTNVTFKVPEKGLVKFDLALNGSKDQVISMVAEYKGEIYEPWRFEPLTSPSLNFIKVTMMDGSSPRIGEKLRFNVATTEPIDRVVGIVTSKGDIVSTETFYFESKSQQHLLEIKIEHSMAPRATLVVYYIRLQNKEVVADSLVFDLDGIFRTPVDIETSAERAEPGQNMDINIKTNPNSFVAVLGLDQSVLLLKSGNDLTREVIKKELATYDADFKDSREASLFSSYMYTLGLYENFAAAANILKSAGMIILSNGIVLNYYPTLLYRGSMPLLDPPAPVAMRSKKFKEVDIRLNSNRPIVKVRKHFPETWLWANQTSGPDGIARFSSKIPDTITTWIVSAFAVDRVTGLGVVERPAKITVFRPFFVKLNLPYSVIRGETVAIQVLIFNYMSKPQDAEVTLYNEDKEFNFTVASNEIDTYLSDSSRSQFVSIDPESATSISFLISTNRVGSINLKVTALAGSAGDTVIKQLLVKPEGRTQYFNRAVLLDYTKSESIPNNHLVPLWMPNNAIPGSKGVSVSVTGDALGTCLNNLDDLLKMPYGCGEQNMINLVSNIVVLRYLKEAKRLTREIEIKALNHMELGYQRELTYRRIDSSFSAFGSDDDLGSTWLTAFVLKTFHQAKDFITVDPKVLDGATDFLFSRQRADGSFVELGEIHFKAMQGGSAESSGTLTAFVVIALCQDLRDFRSKYPDFVLESTEKYLNETLAASKSSYETNIISYALHLMRSGHAETGLVKTLAGLQFDGDVSFWADQTDTLNLTKKQSSHFFLPKSTDIESTAYGLLTLVGQNQIGQALPVMKWLISRQNAQGGFSSTQDTVIALQSLASIASHFSSPNTSIEVTFKFGDPGESQSSQTFQVNGDNSQILQKYEMTDAKGGTIPKQVEITTTGAGVAVVQVSWQYNLAVSAEEPAFFLNPLLGQASTDNFLQLNVCTYYKAGNSTNMAVMEVELPSGYSADVEALQSIKSQGNGIKRVESHNGDTNVVIYFDRITREELCVTVPAHRTQKVSNNKPVPVVLYDYYNRQESARMMYEPRMTMTCSICTNSKDCQCNLDGENEAIRSENSKLPSTSIGGRTRNQLIVILILQLIHFILIH